MRNSHTTKKFALIHMGTDIVYSLQYVAAEIQKYQHNLQWFDGDSKKVVLEITGYKPDFLVFSPLTTFFKQAVELSRQAKAENKKMKSVFGGCHVSAVPESIENDAVDIVVKGPVFGTIDSIINNTKPEVIEGHPVPPEEMVASGRDYFSAIPRIATRHRKAIMSHFGCVFNCSYCSTSRVRKQYGVKLYNKYWMTRRPIKTIIEEAKVFLEYPTAEVTLADDDILYGKDIEGWLSEFSNAWKSEINLPLYGNISPKSAVTASDKTMEVLADLVDSVSMGVQTARRESLKLFNRQHQSEEQVKAAFERLKSYNIPTKLELIIGLPLDDPVGDAIDTIKLAQRVSAGTFAATFPLMIYPGTSLHDWCIKHDIPMNDECSYD